MVIGLLLFMYLSIQIFCSQSLEAFAKYLFTALFTLIGASIAILLDVKPSTVDPNVKPSAIRAFDNIGNAVSFNKTSVKSSSWIGLIYAIIYLGVGCFAIFKAVKGENEYISSIASAFSGLILAVLTKYIKY